MVEEYKTYMWLDWRLPKLSLTHANTEHFFIPEGSQFTTLKTSEKVPHSSCTQNRLRCEAGGVSCSGSGRIECSMEDRIWAPRPSPLFFLRSFESSPNVVVILCSPLCLLTWLAEGRLQFPARDMLCLQLQNSGLQAFVWFNWGSCLGIILHLTDLLVVRATNFDQNVKHMDTALVVVQVSTKYCTYISPLLACSIAIVI